MNNKSTLYGYLMGIGAVFFWSFNVIIARGLVGVLSPVQISFGRWFFAALFLLPFTAKVMLRDKELIAAHFKLIFAQSMTGVVLMNLLVYYAGQTTSAINMSLLGTVGPIFLVVFSALLLHVKVSMKQLSGFAAALLGVLTIITRGNLFNLEKFTFVIGDLWMLAMTVMFGLYGVLQSKKIEGLSSVSQLSAVITVAVIVFLPFFLMSLAVNPPGSVSGNVWMILIYMGVLPSLFSFFCWNGALERLGGLKTSLIYYLMPVFSTIEAYFLLGEKISAPQVYGGLLVVIGVFIAAYHRPVHPVSVKRI